MIPTFVGLESGKSTVKVTKAMDAVDSMVLCTSCISHDVLHGAKSDYACLAKDHAVWVHEDHETEESCFRRIQIISAFGCAADFLPIVRFLLAVFIVQ